MKTNNTIYDEIRASIEKMQYQQRFALEKFMNLLFWRDYKDNYITPDEKQSIARLMDTVYEAGPDGETWLEWDDKKGLELANIIRVKIGLPQIYLDKNGTLYELVDDVCPSCDSKGAVLLANPNCKKCNGKGYKGG